MHQSQVEHSVHVVLSGLCLLVYLTGHWCFLYGCLKQRHLISPITTYPNQHIASYILPAVIAEKFMELLQC